MELIVDMMLPTQGNFSICNQVDDQYTLLLPQCLHAIHVPIFNTIDRHGRQDALLCSQATQVDM